MFFRLTNGNVTEIPVTELSNEELTTRLANYQDRLKKSVQQTERVREALAHLQGEHDARQAAQFEADWATSRPERERLRAEVDAAEASGNFPAFSQALDALEAATPSRRGALRQ